jgi:hypothetical protein
VDIKVFILTVVENSGVGKFSRSYSIKFKKKLKSSEIILFNQTAKIDTHEEKCFHSNTMEESVV